MSDMTDLQCSIDGILNLLESDLTPKESFMRDLAADLRYAIIEITRLRSDNATLREAFEINEKDNAEYIVQIDEMDAVIDALRDALRRIKEKTTDVMVAEIAYAALRGEKP